MEKSAPTENPQPEEMRQLFNRVAPDYDQGGVDFFGPVARRLVRLSGIAAGDVVLDIGCGRGAELFPVADAVGEGGSVLGIDISEEMIGYARAAIPRRDRDRVTVQLMDGRQPELPAASFDAVISSFCMFIWVREAADLRPYARLLRPGGKLAISAPSFFPRPGGRWAFIPEPVYDLLVPYSEAAAYASGPAGPAGGTSAPGRPLADFRNNWLVSPDSVTKALTDAGFDQVSVREEELPLTFGSGAAWIEWTRSTGMRRLWDRIPEQGRDALTREVAARLDGLRDQNGAIVFHAPITYIRASVAVS